MVRPPPVSSGGGAGPAAIRPQATTSRDTSLLDGRQSTTASFFPTSNSKHREPCDGSNLSPLAAGGESLAAFDGRCIPGGCVAPRSNTAGILGRRALPAGRLARLGATPDFHHGLLILQRTLKV